MESIVLMRIVSVNLRGLRNSLSAAGRRVTLQKRKRLLFKKNKLWKCSIFRSTVLERFVISNTERNLSVYLPYLKGLFFFVCRFM